MPIGPRNGGASPQGILSSILWVSTGRYGTFIVNFACQLALIRILVPEDFGKFAFTVAIADTILLFVSSWSFPLALIQIKGVKNLESTILVLSLFAFALVIVLALLGGLILARLLDAVTAKLFLGLVVVKGMGLLSGIYGALLRREFNFKSWSLIQGFAIVLSAGAALGAAIAGFGLWSLFIGEVVLQGVLYIGFRLFTSWPYGLKFDPEAAKKVFAFSGKMFVSSGLEVFQYSIDKLLVGYMFGSKGLGFYERSQYLCRVSTSSMTSLSVNIGFPAFARVQNDPRRLEKGLNTSNFFFTRMSLMFLVTIFLFPTDIMKMLGGEKWVPAADVLRWFALYIFVIPPFWNLRVLLQACGQITPVIKAEALRFISFIPLFFILARVYGLEGAALAFVVSTAIGSVMLLHVVRKEGLLPQLYILRPILASLITVVVLMNLDGVLQDTPSLFKLLTAPVLFGMLLIPFEISDLRSNTKLLLRR
ncbi:MAG: oligosaccharide flippase family protein [Candidatus Brocadiales bacterium]